jgi:putative phosphoesterase
VRVLVLSDTHIPDFAKRLPDGLAPHLLAADVIVHAGDVTSPSVLDELAAYAPVHAALGNGDGPDVAAWGAREEVRLSLDGIPTAMVHISGPAKGRERRLLRRFPEARIIVFGHSHIPWNVEENGVLLFNPGSPTWKRRQPHPTFGVLTLEHGRVLDASVVELP